MTTEVECEVHQRIELALRERDFDVCVDILFAERDVLQKPSLCLFWGTRHAEMDASGVTVADGRNADLIQISGQPAAFKLFCERKPLLGVLHGRLILRDEMFFLVAKI